MLGGGKNTSSFLMSDGWIAYKLKVGLILNVEVACNAPSWTGQLMPYSHSVLSTSCYGLAVSRFPFNHFIFHALLCSLLEFLICNCYNHLYLKIRFRWHGGFFI